MGYELKALRENMRIRGVIKNKFFVLRNPIKYAACMLVPLLMRMIKVSDELSASALIRGLDSGDNRVTIVELRFKVMDLIAMIIGIFAVISVVVIQRQI